MTLFMRLLLLLTTTRHFISANSAEARGEDAISKVWPLSLFPYKDEATIGSLALAAAATELPEASRQPTPRLRSRSMQKLTPDASKEEDELEKEARAIDAEFAHSEQLVSEAWDSIRRAPLIPAPTDGPGHRSEQRSVMARIQDLAESVPVLEWYFYVVYVVLAIAVDLVVLQHLPEIERTHVALLAFWMLVAVGFCVEVWMRQGQKEGISWASGYILELVFSMENVFIFNLIFHTLETPRRLMRKALMVTVLGSIVMRFLFYVGLADVIYKASFLPMILGAWLIYCGTQQVAVKGRCEDEAGDVTQTMVVRTFRWCLGERLGEFYDEEGEAIILFSGKKPCVTLLGVAIACLLTADLFFGADATLVKLELVPNPYFSISSSVLALFTLRALFSVVRDILSHLSLARYCTGIILLFVGAEMLAARFTEVSALMSVIVVMNVIMLMATFSAVRDSTCPKQVV